MKGPVYERELQVASTARGHLHDFDERGQAPGIAVRGQVAHEHGLAMLSGPEASGCLKKRGFPGTGRGNQIHD
jgi:hypothetical protein